MNVLEDVWPDWGFHDVRQREGVGVGLHFILKRDNGNYRESGGGSHFWCG